MSTEEKRRKALSELPLFKKCPEYLELYLYHAFDKDDSFLTQDLLRENGKPSKPAINNKTVELVIIMGLELFNLVGDDYE